MLDKSQSEQSPIYKKSLEMMEIALALCESIDESKDVMELKPLIAQNAYFIPPKISTANAVNHYGDQMECAVLIRRAAREIQSATAALRVENLSKPDYIEVLRDHINDFRLLLKEWVVTFDPSTLEEWEWSLDVKGNLI